MHISPFGVERDDLRIARLCAIVVALVTGKPSKIGDFMFKEIEAPKRKTPKEMFNVLRTMTNLVNSMRRKGDNVGNR